MQIPRYVVGAFLFGLIWAAIVYSNGKVTDITQLAAGVLFVGVVGSILSWGLTKLIHWYKSRS